MGRACSTYGGDEKFTYNFGLKPEAGRHKEDLGIDGVIISNWILGKEG
jgi:hypothetical protein